MTESDSLRRQARQASERVAGWPQWMQQIAAAPTPVATAPSTSAAQVDKK